MLKFDYNNVREEVVGTEHGLNIQAANAFKLHKR